MGSQMSRFQRLKKMRRRIAIAADARHFQLIMIDLFARAIAKTPR